MMKILLAPVWKAALVGCLLHGLSAGAWAQNGPNPATPTALLAFTPSQIQALGIRTQPVQAPQPAESPALPAQVSIPNDQQRVVAAPLAGLVESLGAAPGEAVRAGQVLVRIASPQALELQRDRLQAEAQTTLARQSLARDEQLFKEGLIAESRLQQTRALAAQAQAQLQERRQELGLAQAADGQHLLLRAPIAGHVLEQLVSVGQRVEAATPLYRIARLQPLNLEIQAPLDVAQQAKPGTALEVLGLSNQKDSKDQKVSGQLITVGRHMDAGNQSVLLRGRIDQGAEQLRPGQGVSVRLSLPARAKAQEPSIPARAVVHQNKQTWVFVAAREGAQSGFRPTPVRLNGQRGDAVGVSGLAPDAQVVVDGIAALKARWLGIGAE